MSNMTQYLLAFVETNKKAATDEAYILEAAKKYYPDTYTKLTIQHMDTKSAYNSRKVNKIIKEFKDNSDLLGVLICIDTDEYNLSIQDVKMNEEIKSYCAENNYELVWFCRDVEEVFWDSKVNDKQKINKAKQFVKSKRINSFDQSKLRYNEYGLQHSNLLRVLDKFL